MKGINKEFRKWGVLSTILPGVSENVDVKIAMVITLRDSFPMRRLEVKEAIIDEKYEK